MQAYTDIVPPSAVTHAIHSPFISADASNLIVARASLLQIFDVRPVPAQHGKHKHGRRILSLLDRAGEHYPGPYPKGLFLIAEYHLSGIVADLKSVKIANSKSGGHLLLVALKSAKVSLVQWDPNIFSISTTSIHLFEESPTVNPLAPDLAEWPTYLTVDPGEQCAVLRFGPRNVAFIPFRTTLGDGLGEEEDDAADGQDPATTATQDSSNAGAASNRPYTGSFALSLQRMDPSLVHITDLALLHGYRDPTLGVISSSRDPAPALSERLRDSKTYSVLQLDLEQKATTKLLEVFNLPNDIFQLKPLPPPIGGMLLIGGNEIIHVDQESTRTTGCMVNEFARVDSSFSDMSDQSRLKLKLEGCVVEHLQGTNGDLLFCLSNGQFVLVSFKRDGRVVSGFTISKVLRESGGRIVKTSAVCAASVDSTTLFVAGDDSDALLLGCINKGPVLSRKRSRAEMLGIDEAALDEEDVDEEAEEDDIDDDDIYDVDGSAGNQRGGSNSHQPTDIVFSIMDVLPNFAAHGEAILAPAFRGRITDLDLNGCLVFPVGRRSAGGFAILSNEVVPKSTQRLEGITYAKRAWFVESMGDDFIFTSGLEMAPASRVYQMRDGNTILLESTDLDEENETLQVHAFGSGKRLVQVTGTELRLLDTELQLAQIVPMLDESTEEEFQIMHTSFLDPFLLVIRNDNSAILLKANANNEYEPHEGIQLLTNKIWTAGCLYREQDAEHPILLLVDKEHALHVLDMKNSDETAVKFESLIVTPLCLTSDPMRGRSVAREEILEILLTDLGDESAKQPYLMITTAANDVMIYQPFHIGSAHTNFIEGLRWLKVGSIPLFDGDPSHDPISEFPTKLVPYNGMVLVSGLSSTIVSKSATTMPTYARYSGMDLRSFSGAGKHSGTNRVLAVNSECEISLNDLHTDTLAVGDVWLARPIPLKQEVLSMCYHNSSRNFVLGVGQIEEFDLPEDQYHPKYAKENLDLKPTQVEGSIKLMSAATNKIIDEYVLASDEVAICIKSCSLDLSPNPESSARREMIVAGTAISQGEDLPCNGSIYFFDIIEVVPEEGLPETGYKLKLVGQEDVKGAVTAISGLERPGLVALAQGQKCMVRGLRDDNVLSPVAFQDMPCYIRSLKSLKGSEMMLMADVAKGIYYTGYSEQPYKVTLFGRSKTTLKVVTAEFLPCLGRLFFPVAAPDSKMQILEYNPDHPESLQGQRLLHKNTFHTGHPAASMSSLVFPSSEGNTEGSQGSEEREETSSQVIITTQTGAIGLVSNVDEETYRQLGAVQAYLQTSLDHPCGLNPRAYREVESEGWGNRGILDGNILRLWHKLPAQRRLDACTRAGVESWKLKLDTLMLADARMEHYNSKT